MDKELTQEFKKIDQRFEKMDKRFDKTDQRFETLMNFLGEHMSTNTEMKTGFATLRAELADKSDIDRVYTAVDTVAKDYVNYSQELTALKHQFEQMNEFNKQVAAKLGLKYEA